MPLYKLDEFDTNYRDTFGNSDIKGYDVYSSVGNDKIGSVKNILVDETGRIRYLVIDTGFWVFGKNVLLPIGRTRIDYGDRRVNAVGLTKEQVENLPEFEDLNRVNYDYEEQVRGVYRSTPVEAVLPLDSPTSLEASAPLDAVPGYQQPVAAPVENRESYTYHQEPDLYQVNERDHQTLKLYEERLVANKRRVQTGEVTVGKHIETETAQVSVPVEKERVIIERTTPAEAGRVVAPGEATFGEAQVARIDLYEETADVHKEAILREEVNIRKVVEQDTVQAQETLRREELDIDTDADIDNRRL